LAALIAILIFLLGFFSASYFASRLTEVAAVNDHIEDLKQVEAFAVAYWIGEDPNSAEFVAHKLRGKLHASSVFRSRFGGILGARHEEYIELEGRLFDLATGGGFQTKSFKPDAQIAVSVMQVCNEMRAVLRSARRHLYWVH
jgi:hypothetical protein